VSHSFRVLRIAYRRMVCSRGADDCYYGVRARCGIIVVHFFRKTGNRSNKGRCIARITVFICGVLCRAFPLGIPVASKEITHRHRFFRTRARGWG
jgi:hypothetical protein